MRKWRIDDSSELYNVEGWGIGYFDISKNGNLTIMPHRNPEQSIEIKDILDQLNMRDVAMPVLLRFPDILNERLETITTCFKKAAEEYSYTGNYFTVYPIKVNQQRPVVEEIVRYGKKNNIGIEAGSKPELHAVLAIMDNPEALIVCNGYKDEDYIELALLAQKMGKRIFIVAEKYNELRLIMKLAKTYKVKPNIGIRIKLAAFGSGKWEDSGGDKSKFGLTSGELMEAVEFLEQENALDCMKLIHCHLGSQITNIRKIKRGLREASQFFVQLSKLGCNIEYVDVGGGLGVDYDGTRTTISSSINYSIQEYANDAIYTIVDAATKNDLPHPHLITESGRALTAHHSILVFNVLETTCPPKKSYNDFDIQEDEHEIIKELHTILDCLTDLTMIEAWHDAQQIREEVLDLFNLGMVDLRTRALAEQLYWSIAYDVRELARDQRHPPEELQTLDKVLAEKYFCNFSLFQSLPDSWAIDQLFPIMPLHRLNEKPKHYATLQDITCDSDGKIDRFIGNRSYNNCLQLHHLKHYEPYYLGVFMVGAYQEILGDLHNLFGDTNVVHVGLAANGKLEIEQIIDGETIEDVLEYVQFDAKKLVRTVESWVASSVKNKKISVQEGKEFLAIYRSGLYGYTYLE